MPEFLAPFLLDTPGLTPVFALLALQIVLGGLDNLLHHEMTEALPAKPGARRELALHSARELIYAGVFAVFALLRPEGGFAILLAAVLVIEIVITLADFVEEDRTRVLPPFERVLHTVLALNYGAILALLAPVLWSWAQAPAGLAIEIRGAWTPILLIAAAGVGAWGVRDLIAALQPDAPARAPEPSGRNVLVTGATGFLGQALTTALKARGDAVIALSRTPARAARRLGVAAVGDLADLPADTRIHAVINLAGANVADRPWSAARRRTLMNSRLTVTRAVTGLIERLDHKPDVLVSASAVGIYGDGGDAVLDETAPSPEGVFTADLCRAWEAAAGKARRAGVRTVVLRFGLVFGRDGGAFPRLVMTRALGVLARFGSGRQWMAWIHKADAVGLILHALDTPALNGPVNAVAPAPARHGEVIAALTGRRLVIPVPACLLKAGLGEMSRLFLDSQKVRARTALASGYAFTFPTLGEAVTDLTDRRRFKEAEPCAT
ncbi:MAG: TIGR01777 family oxidoreductase [Oceanicaulis sp.]